MEKYLDNCPLFQPLEIVCNSRTGVERIVLQTIQRMNHPIERVSLPDGVYFALIPYNVIDKKKIIKPGFEKILRKAGFKESK